MDRGDWGLRTISVIFWFIVLIVVIYIIYRVVSSNRDNPLDIAKNRYAKDEITKEQYLEIKKELK
jgi:uncharacterized membrane protein